MRNINLENVINNYGELNKSIKKQPNRNYWQLILLNY